MFTPRSARARQTLPRVPGRSSMRMANSLLVGIRPVRSPTGMVSRDTSFQRQLLDLLEKFQERGAFLANRNLSLNLITTSVVHPSVGSSQAQLSVGSALNVTTPR